MLAGWRCEKERENGKGGREKGGEYGKENILSENSEE
jgi:hypothetical protein